MKIKIKHIDKRNWKRVLKKDCVWMDMQEREGLAYLIHIQEVTEPLIAPCFGQNVKLADVGYYWLQIAFKDENFWLTAMYDEKGEPFTPHTTNPVPFCVVGYDCELREGGRLADIAPSMLKIMGLDQPAEMNGESIIK